jgi:hypothetical protein
LGRYTGDVTAEGEIIASFQSRADAEAALAALTAAGVPESAITVREAELPPVSQREGRYLWRLLVIIVLWSIAGGAIGAGFGVLLAATVGPSGTTGLIFQVVCWTITGHLVIGMIAGYVVLADRTHPEMEPERPEVVVTVRIPPADVGRVHGALRGAGARRVIVPGPAGATSRR